MLGPECGACGTLPADGDDDDAPAGADAVPAGSGGTAPDVLAGGH